MTAMPDHLELHGCRHDILGYDLKAIGLLRAADIRASILAKSASADENHA